MAYIEFRDLNKSYKENHVLKNINLSIEKDSFVTLLGASGCGKTTLLRSLAGLEGIDSGKVILGGEDITNLHPRERNVSMIFQHYSLFPTMNVFNNIAYGLKIKKLSRESIRKEVEGALAAVELSDKAKCFPSQLSGGEQQRVAIARSIVTKPKVLLLDEPFNAIDARLRKELQIKIKHIHREYGMTSIMVTHDQDEAMTMSDKIHFFKAGRIEQSDSPINLYMNPKNIEVASFMGNYNIFKPEIFNNLVRGSYKETNVVAIRPEAFILSSNSIDQNNCFCITGEVIESIPQQNIARYIINASGFRIYADTLIDNLNYYKKGQAINLIVEKSKVVYYCK